MLKRTILCVIASFLFTLFVQPAWSQTTRATRIVVPVLPGGGSDVLARLLADQIGQAHGPAMVIDNRPGAGSLVGTEAVSRAPPDGSSLLITTESLLIIPHLRKVT
jgi:tripartite-type tricarboxylate transporter receptor subunit TctC